MCANSFRYFKAPRPLCSRELSLCEVVTVKFVVDGIILIDVVTVIEHISLSVVQWMWRESGLNEVLERKVDIAFWQNVQHIPKTLASTRLSRNSHSPARTI